MHIKQHLDKKIICRQALGQGLLLLVVVISLFSVAVCSNAAEVHDLYSATVPVFDQTTQSRQQAITQAFRQVLIKVSGHSNVANNHILRSDYSDAKRFLRQYGYENLTDPDEPTSPKIMALRASFDHEGINDVLNGAGQAIWGKNRPLTLVWLAVTSQKEGRAQQYLVANNAAYQIPQLLEQDAKSRGIPILLPMLDLQDLQTVSVNDILQGDTKALEQASQRYGSDAILIGQVSQQPSNSWQGDWRLFVDNTQAYWQVQGATIDQVIAQSIDHLADNLASRFSVQPNNTSQEQQLTIIVTNVNNLQAYAKIMKYLSQLAPVKQAELLQVSPGQLMFHLKVIGGQTALIRAISLDHALKPMTVMGVNDNKKLYYQWVMA